MRDDLHRTVSLARPWRPVLKYVSREADLERVPIVMSQAIRAEVEAGIGIKWALSFKNALISAGQDLFDLDRNARVLNDFERNNPTPLQRRFCETARGLYARDQDSERLYERTVGELCRQLAKSNIEHVVAQIREEHGLNQANQLRKRLLESSSKCLFEPKKNRRRRSKQDGVLDLLDFTIKLKF